MVLGVGELLIFIFYTFFFKCCGIIILMIQWIHVMVAIQSTLEIEQTQNKNYCLIFLPELLGLWI